MTQPTPNEAVAKLHELWLARAQALGYPAKGIRREEALMDFICGYAAGLREAGGPDISMIVFLVSVRGESYLSERQAA